MARLTIGLTGGIGSGKSAATTIFESLGICVVDADIIAREVVAKGMPALRAIVKHFGEQILLDNGELDRAQLRAHIFSHPEDKQWLEALLHPTIRESMVKQLKEANSSYAILASPLLFETNQDQLVDTTLLIDCDEALQMRRAMARDNANEEGIKAIIASQMPRQARIAKADHIIDNSADLESLRAAITQFHHLQLQNAQQ